MVMTGRNTSAWTTIFRRTTLYFINLTWTALGSTPSLHCEKKAANRLSYDSVQVGPFYLFALGLFTNGFTRQLMLYRATITVYLEILHVKASATYSNNWDYLLTPWSRVLLEKLTGKLCS